jgi:Uma2 family endonuclease
MSATALMTVAQFDQLPKDGQVHELLEGEHLESPFPKSGHARLQRRIAQELDKHCPRQSESFVEAGYQLSEYTLLGPDVSLTFPEQTAGDANKWFQGSPMIAVEVVSPSNSAREIARKISVYLHHGAHEVWVVYPEDRQVHVHEAGGIAHRYEDFIRSSVLPELAIDLNRLFSGLT